MKTASNVFEEALDWIIENYEKFGFQKERDKTKKISVLFFKLPAN